MTLRIQFVVTGFPDSASSRYRAAHLRESLVRGKNVDVSITSVSNAAPVSVRQGEVLVLHRVGFAGIGERLLSAARRVGAVAVWGSDDLIFTHDFSHQIGLHFPDDPVRYKQHRAAVEDFRRMLAACDAALVSTEYLADQARSAHPENKPICVVRNFLSDAHLAQAKVALETQTTLPPSDSPSEPQQVTLAYLSGSATHDIDLGTIASSLAAVLTRFPQARLLLVGPVTLPPLLRPFAESGQILRHCFVPWQDLPGLFTFCHVDISLAPLDTSRPFIHAKSEVKFLEAASVGVPSIASHARGFAEGVRNGTDCLLASNPGDWERLMTELIENPERRRHLGEAARESVRLRGTSAANAETVRSVFEQLANLAPAPTSTTYPTVCQVRPTVKERLLQRAKEAELHLMRRNLRLSRHFQRLREDAGGG